MPLYHWFRPPRHLLTLFLAGTVAASVLLAWLGWRFIDQERALAAQRAQERLENAADRVASILQRSLDGLEEQLAAGGDALPDDAVVLIAGPDTLEARPPDRLVFYPPAPTPEETAPDVFHAVEAVEFTAEDSTRAADAYRKLARSADPAVKAGALVRLGRTLRNAGLFQEALQAYAELLPFGDTPVVGLPAGLVAREARCSVLEKMDQHDELAREAADLYHDLESGQYSLPRPEWTFFLDEAKTWAGPAAVEAPNVEEAVALSSAAESLWRRQQELPAEGRAVEFYGDQPVLTLWKAEPGHLTAVVAGRRYLENVAGQAAKEAGVHVALSDREGAPVIGASTGMEAVRGAASTHQPWDLHISSANPALDAQQDGARQRLLLSGFAVVGLLLVTGGYFTFRGIHRELAAAQLQSDFVSAVSHEFRTPLTSMRQFSQMLSQGRVIQEDRRQKYYDLLVRESERLHRLVEGLLNFSRMEAGAAPYQFAPVEANELAQSVALEFTRLTEDCQVEVSPAESPCMIHADREALSLALWNLLDNAQKYSPECRTVWVDVTCNGKQASIAVRDRGAGIPAAEQSRIFSKFVRGTSAAGTGVQGVGVGLAMVRNIMKAHGGDVQLESEPGRGSTFTLVLPLERTT